MTRTPRWTVMSVQDGIEVINLSSWKWFHDFISQQLLDYTNYIYRGQTRADWRLEPTLDRMARRLGRAPDARFRATQLHDFRQAARGRRGANPQSLDTDNDWWALGQHFGLATPLLDWTRSPFVAAYFAFIEEQPRVDIDRVIWAVFTPSLEAKSLEIQRAGTTKPLPIVEIVDPFLEDNARLVNQRGLFTQAPDGVPLEQWVRRNFPGETHWIALRFRLRTKTDQRASAT